MERKNTASLPTTPHQRHRYRYIRGQGLETLEPEIRTPTNDDFILPPPLESLVDKENLVHKFIPKQGDIDKLISKINKKVLRDTNLCIDLRDLKQLILQVHILGTYTCTCYRIKCP